MLKQKTSLFELFITFAKISVMTFGGGYAMLPLIERELVAKKHWIDQKDLLEFFAVSQITPGVIAVNAASLIGQRRRGIIGLVAATLGVAAPSVIIITIVAAFLSNIMQFEIVGNIFAALRIAVAALIINALFPLFKKGITGIFTGLLFLITFIAFYFFKISPILLVILCAAATLIVAKAKGALK
ncbi:MAG: chromate transporter [Elusimicrobiota bacterium]|jgi:chromate transporter|nr:chromate transporter [Elusimicrobiota bacterium]